MPAQTLLLRLDGITAADYLAHCLDPEAPALGFGLRAFDVDADPLGDTVRVRLDWDRTPPSDPHLAAGAAGFRLTADVVDCQVMLQVARLRPAA